MYKCAECSNNPIIGHKVGCKEAKRRIDKLNEDIASCDK